MKCSPASLPRVIERRLIYAALLWLCLLLNTGPVSAACTMINVPAMLSGKLTLVGSASPSKLGRHLHANPITVQFSFKCDTDITYNLMVTEGAAGPGMAAILRDAHGNQVVTAITLRSIDAKSVNLDFMKMPVSGYAGRALRGKVYQVILEMTPLDMAVTSTTEISENFTGNLKIAFQY